MNTFFKRLQSETQAARTDMMTVEQLQRGALGTISLSTYSAYLTEAYHHVKHTTPLLMACGSRISPRQELLRDAIAEYIEEELGHQEWILNDIKACGKDSEAVRHGQPRPATEIMISYAYDSITRGNPLSFFGMVLVLEGTSTTLATTAAETIRESLKRSEERRVGKECRL